VDWITGSSISGRQDGGFKILSGSASNGSIGGTSPSSPRALCPMSPEFQRRRVAEVRGKVAHGMNREMGISMAEIARHLGEGASAIAMAIRKAEPGKSL
jgi:hypothetical protein